MAPSRERGLPTELAVLFLVLNVKDRQEEPANGLGIF
jgi:hypothetical protein